MVQRVTPLLCLVAVLGLSCSSAEEQRPAPAPVELDPETYGRRYVKMRELTVLLWSTGEFHEFNASLRGRIMNRGDQKITRMIVAYGCKDSIKLSGAEAFGPLDPGESIAVDKVVRTVTTASTAYRCFVELESLRF